MSTIETLEKHDKFIEEVSRICRHILLFIDNPELSRNEKLVRLNFQIGKLNEKVKHFNNYGIEINSL